MFNSRGLILCAGLALLFSRASELRAQEDSSPPNIILMMADDLGWADPGFMGNQEIRTPHLDEMAAAGLRFNRFYAAAPVCSPTRGSCVTGRHPFRYGIFHANVGHMRAQELTLAELLKAQGYATGHFGKWHLGTLTTEEKDSNRGGPRSEAHFSPPWENGFETCFSTEAKVPTWDPLLAPKKNRRRTWWDPVESVDEATSYGTAYWSNGEKVTDNTRGDDSRVIMDRAIPFIREAAEAKKPFFAIVWFHAPHLPVVAGPKYTAPYQKFDKYKQHYYGCITALDEQVGRLRKELRGLGVEKNTMVWFCSDNGPEGSAGRAPGSAGPLRGRKRDLYEGGIRVPGLLEWPAQVPEPRVTDVPACTSDYLPTILAALDIRLPDLRPIDGINLLPLIRGDMQERPGPIAFQFGKQDALIGNRYKLVRSKGQAELFDLQADIGEKQDLAGEHPQKVKAMSAVLDTWKNQCRESLGGKDYR